MRSDIIVIAGIGSQKLAQMSLTQNNEVVHALAPDRSDQPFGASILPRRKTCQGLVEQLFVQGIADGQLRQDLDPKLATLALLGLCNSVISNRGLPRSSRVDNIIEEYARLLTTGVAAAVQRPVDTPGPNSKTTKPPSSKRR